MIQSDNAGLRLVTILDRGVPNKEAVAIRAQEDIEMSEFSLILAVRDANRGLIPIRDYFFWFGNGVVNEGDWIFVYTCKGNPRSSKSKEGNQTIHSLHWGKDITLFADSQIVPLLVSLNLLDIGETPRNMPQLGIENN